MNRMFACSIAVLSASALYLAATTASAQPAVPTMPSPQTGQAGGAQPGQFAGGAQEGQLGLGPKLAALHDIFLGEWIGADNQAEITLNEFAARKASNKDVKDFTQKMIHDHSQLATKLNQTLSKVQAAAFPRVGRTPYTAAYGNQPGTTQAAPPVRSEGTSPGSIQSTIPPAAQSPANVQPGGAATGAGAGMAPNPLARFTPINFKREIDGKLVALTQQQLDKKSGEDFDRCFMQGQIDLHTNMLATLEVAISQASPELKPDLQQALQVTQQHLSLAESLANKLEPKESR